MKSKILLILLLPIILSAAPETLQQKTTATTPATDDWTLLQGTTNGMRKLAPSYYAPKQTFPALVSPSGDQSLQRWGGVMTSGGQAGGGLTDVTFGMTRDIAGPSSTKLSDNWGLTYNRNGISGSPRYGWAYESVYDVSMSSGGVSGEVYHEHRIDNGAGGAAAGSVVGGRLLQWNITLPTSFAESPSNAATYNTANGTFPGHVGLIGVINSFAISAYDSAGSGRATWTWATSSAEAGITINSNTGFSYQRFSQWGGRGTNDENSIVGSATATMNMRTATSGFSNGDGAQVTHSGSDFSVNNFEAGAIKFTTNGASFNDLMRLTTGQRVFIGYNGTGITDSGDPLQVKGSGGTFTSTSDTVLKVVGGNYPGIKITGTSFPSGVDIACEASTDFRIRINDAKPLLLMTSGTSRMNIHSTNSSYAPFNIGPSATPGTSMARVKHGVATLTTGAVTVSETTTTANSRIFLTSQVDGGTVGFLRVSARTASTSFTITSSSAIDTSTVAWMMVEP